MTSNFYPNFNLGFSLYNPKANTDLPSWLDSCNTFIFITDEQLKQFHSPSLCFHVPLLLTILFLLVDYA